MYKWSLRAIAQIGIFCAAGLIRKAISGVILAFCNINAPEINTGIHLLADPLTAFHGQRARHCATQNVTSSSPTDPGSSLYFAAKN